MFRIIFFILIWVYILVICYELSFLLVFLIFIYSFYFILVLFILLPHYLIT